MKKISIGAISLAGAMLSLAGCGTAAQAPAPNALTPNAMTNAARWGKPVFVDDFRGSKLNTKYWNVYDSPSGHPPRIKQAVHVRRGALQIVGAIRNGKNASGGISMKAAQWHGRWVARVRASKGAGYSPVVLLWPKSNKWPADGEIDVIEIPNPTRKTAHEYVHNGAANHKKGHMVHVDFTHWHTVAVDWRPHSITYWIDGKKRWTVSSKSLIPSTSPMHLALQNDQGCSSWIPCRTRKTPRWVTMYVDWVKVYRLP